MTTREKGTCLRLYVHENQRHKGVLMYEWLLEHGKKMGLHGGTAYRSIAGFGHHGRIHEQRFFELAGDQTIRVNFFVTDDEAEHMITLIEAEKIPMFYARFPVDFGIIGIDG